MKTWPGSLLVLTVLCVALTQLIQSASAVELELDSFRQFFNTKATEFFNSRDSAEKEKDRRETEENRRWFFGQIDADGNNNVSLAELKNVRSVQGACPLLVSVSCTNHCCLTVCFFSHYTSRSPSLPLQFIGSIGGTRFDQAGEIDQAARASE